LCPPPITIASYVLVAMCPRILSSFDPTNDALNLNGESNDVLCHPP
jgi:hypothetical protein